MYGTNPIRLPSKGDGHSLDVQNIFLTVQGEGPNAGHKAVFIRLGGCNLACGFCDTEFESFTNMSVDEILEKNTAIADGARLAVITGGEPFRQPIEKLAGKLIAQGYRVQVETNGTLFRELPGEVEIICSPKNNGTGYFMLRPDIAARVSAFKFIISAHRKDYDHVGKIIENKPMAPIYVQPMDEYDPEKNRQNMHYALALAIQHGYYLSLQTHKIAGLE